MSAISLKSITGITSITTPAGVDNQLTLHTNDTTQRVKVTESGVEIAGVITASQGLKINVSPAITIRDGTTEKGYIGFNANDPFIGRKNGVGLSFQNNKIRPVDGDDGSPSNNTVDIGEPTYKFKDGYFAGALNIGTGSSIFSPETNTLTLGTNSAEKFRIDSSGKVKIGNSGGTPDGKLHIDEIGTGDIVAELTSGSPTFTYRNGSGAWFHAGKHPSKDAFVIADGGTTTTNERLLIDSSGRSLFITDGSQTTPLNDSNVPVQIAESSQSMCYIGFNKGSSYGSIIGHHTAFGGTVIRNVVSGSNISFYTNNTSEKLRISSDGYVTTPTNVMFSARGGPADLSNAVIVFPTIVFQRGGTNYNTSTGVFTAPVDGIYHFMCNPYRYTSSSDSYIYLQTSTDSGSTWNSQIEIRGFTNGANGWLTLPLSNLIDLNSGNQVRIYATNRIHCNGVFSRFSGMLVG